MAIGSVIGKEIKEFISKVTSASKEAPKSKPNQFKYSPRHPRDLTGSKSWAPGKAGLSGTQANERINSDYDHLNRQMQTYQSGDPKGAKLPVVSDWAAFGKYASREAGEQIRNLEDLFKGVHGDLGSMANATRNMAAVEPVQQGLLMAGSSVGGLQVPETMVRMRDALVEGNTLIHKHVAPAYDAFLQGESEGGGGGLRRLEEAGYKPGSAKDPQGFVHSAFSAYREAHELGLQAQSENNSEKREELLKQRQQKMEAGNLSLGLQEQMEVLQKPSIFGDPKIQQALGSVSSTMTLTDANGTHALRRDGKNWTDFATRMGLTEVTPGTQGSFAVRDHDGKTIHYKVDPSQTGTISDYFSKNASGRNAERLNAARPRRLESQAETLTGEALQNRSWVKVPAAVMSDGYQFAGSRLEASGMQISKNALDSAGQGWAQGGWQGNAQLALGVLEASAAEPQILAGHALQKMAQVSNFCGDWAQEIVRDLGSY